MPSHRASAGTVTGWGLTGIGQQSRDLMESEIEIFDRDACNAHYLKKNHKANLKSLTEYLIEIKGILNISDAVLIDVARTILGNARGPYSVGLICAGSATGERDSCNGDSGGPLVVKTSNGNFIQVGIVSGGYAPLDPNKHDKAAKCGVPQAFSYYTRVTSYTDWIKKHMN